MDASEAGVKDKLFWAALRTFAAKGYKGATVRCTQTGVGLR